MKGCDNMSKEIDTREEDSIYDDDDLALLKSLIVIVVVLFIIICLRQIGVACGLFKTSIELSKSIGDLITGTIITITRIVGIVCPPPHI